MLTAEQNELLTRVGPGTPCGDMMRRYWHPVAAVSELEGLKWNKRIRLLGEDLVLYRDKQGRMGLITEQCPHRRASLAYGIPTNDGIRCPYHGWEFGHQGQCLSQPNEPEKSSFKNKITTPAYAVEEMGGVFWAYLGPAESKPLLPQLDGFVAEGTVRMLGSAVVPCNWLQIMENSLDPVHTEWLHGHTYEFIKEQKGQIQKVAISDHHEKIAFREFDHGITKHRLLTGQSEDCDDWKVGHPIVFPNILSVGAGDEKFNSRYYAFQIRVPMDDTHTMHLWYTAYVPPKGIKVAPHLLEKVYTYAVPFKDENGEYIMDNVDAQDIMAWITQGAIADRTVENLGASDNGIALYRRVLRREIKKVEEGVDPMFTFRDPEKNVRIDLPNEADKHHNKEGARSWIMRIHAAHSPIAEDVCQMYDGNKPAPQPLRVVG
jgi:5,5'-dehydrodivanillate O-demethylase oxygenase subunit